MTATILLGIAWLITIYIATDAFRQVRAEHDRAQHWFDEANRLEGELAIAKYQSCPPPLTDEQARRLMRDLFPDRREESKPLPTGTPCNPVRTVEGPALWLSFESMGWPDCGEGR